MTPSSQSNSFGEAYLQSPTELTRTLRVVSSEGLSTREAHKRLQAQGPNDLPHPHTHPFLRLFFDRFRDSLVILLIIAAAVAWLIGERTDAFIIGIVIVLDATLSFVHLWRTEQTLASLRQQVAQMTTVLRNGKAQRVPASFLVAGDIIEFRAGEKIPADARVLSTSGLRVAEAALTGESRDIHKSAATLSTRTPLGNRRNMVYLGTVAVSGSGKAVVTATGPRTEFGKIAQMLKVERSPLSPLRRKLQAAGIRIALVVAGLVVIVGAIGVAQGNDLATTAYTAITLLVSAIPEDLTVILTIALTVGVVRILRHHGVVRELSAAETLGATTVICTDKTGTLTVGDMTAETFDCLQGTVVNRAHPPRHEWSTLAMIGFTLASDAHRLAADTAEYFGSATERTALGFAEELGFNQEHLRKQWRQRDSLAFSSQWKYRASLCDHPTQNTRVLFVCGAPEVLLEHSAKALDTNGLATPLSAKRRVALTDQFYAHAGRGERLVGMAIRRGVRDQEITHGDIKELTFVGVLVITDPIRPEARAAMEQTQSAGVAVKLVTGDYEPTARAIAREIGLTVTDEAICSGQMLESMSDAELAATIDHTVVFARVNPLDKQRIIRALQAKGHIVAMTGDGVNDAVALKSADIGVAMGSGKDIAKDAADLVLLDDNFATIVHAIREGRVIRDNVRKVIAFLLATNAAEVGLFLISVFFRWPLPLLPAQILWINLVTDGTSDIALSLEPQERNVMQRRPESPTAPLLQRYVWYHIASVGVIMTLVTATLYWYLWRYLMLDLPYARTMVFTFLAVSSLVSTWSFRSLHESLLRRGLWQNPWLFVSAGFSFALQVGAIYIPSFQRFFGTVPLDLLDWVVVLLLSLFTLAVMELRKVLIPRLMHRQHLPQSPRPLVPARATR